MRSSMCELSSAPNGALVAKPDAAVKGRAELRSARNSTFGRAEIRKGAVLLKRCGRCNVVKPREAFALKSRYAMRWQSYCRSCQHDYYIAYYRDGASPFIDKLRARTIAQRTLNRAFIAGVLMKSRCVDCGLRDPIVLEFDHVRGEKVDSISAMIMAPASIATLKAEVAKCVVRCANCHRIKTSKGWPKIGLGTRRLQESEGQRVE